MQLHKSPLSKNIGVLAKKDPLSLKRRVKSYASILIDSCIKVKSLSSHHSLFSDAYLGGLAPQTLYQTQKV